MHFYHLSFWFKCGFLSFWFKYALLSFYHFDSNLHFYHFIILIQICPNTGHVSISLKLWVFTLWDRSQYDSCWKMTTNLPIHIWLFQTFVSVEVFIVFYIYFLHNRIAKIHKWIYNKIHDLAMKILAWDVLKSCPNCQEEQSFW